MNYLLAILHFELLFLNCIENVYADNVVPYLTLDPSVRFAVRTNRNDFKTNRTARAFESKESSDFLPFEMLINKDKDKDTSEYWRETEILSLVGKRETDVDFEKCSKNADNSIVQFATRRTIRPICKSNIDHQLCPQCPRFSNFTECELFRESCKERKVLPAEYRYYCDRKYGKYQTMFIPADYAQCRCCDECVPYRELDQSCLDDEYSFDADEFLPVTTIDFRAGCNPYWGHPDQETKALKCHPVLRRCVPVNIPNLPNEKFTHLSRRQQYRFEPVDEESDCPETCRGYSCYGGLVAESQCPPGAFLPRPDHCNCCGTCSQYQQLNQKCANYKRTFHVDKNQTEVEVEEEFLEPGCDDGLVCREGVCQDIHTVQTVSARRKRDEGYQPYEPCKKELKYFKKKYGEDGHLHYDAPQCTPLWLYAPVQCRRFVCYCALEDGTFIEGIKVPRVDVSNMNCDCAREKCRTNSDVECDGYGNYKEAAFTPHIDDWTLEHNTTDMYDGSSSSNAKSTADQENSSLVPPAATAH